ncbi:serine hydrolase domain-containing protein [Paenibacillus sp. HB172176]|uniref:serine hydrolase domain-containing protein n=1 Tax=Paenibacillus sp. HB172176 TaxID=2493690 RepID=UPI0014398A75|nr:serine hydrolase domain-containing protein [Paenibacillus sp. HB172176]
MSALQDQLCNYFEHYRKRWPFNGSALVAIEGKILFEEHFGYGSLEHEIPISRSTRFGIWSVTKSFTAAAIMLLRERGKLQLEDEISRYLPPFQALRRITIEQLLHHTSGLANFTSLPQYNKHYNKWPVAKEELLSFILEQGFVSAPGETFAYNNTGYYLLGMILESVTGQSFEAFVAQHILNPLGLTNTGIHDGAKIIPGLASSYHHSGDGVIPSEFIEMSSVFSAGGMYSTLEDLLTWSQALQAGKLLRPETLSDMFGIDGPYAIGWFQDKHLGRKRRYHGGAYRGFRSELHTYPEERLTIVLLSNYNDNAVTAIANQLASIVLNGNCDIPDLPPRISYPHETSDSILGIYEGYGCKAEVGRDDQGYFFLWNDRELNRMFPIAEMTFHHERLPQRYSFKEQPQGTLTFLGMIKKQA